VEWHRHHRALTLKNKTRRAGHLNARNLIWNSKISNPLWLNLLKLFISLNFGIWSPQYPARYNPDGRADVLDVLVYQNVWQSEAIVIDILGSDHLQIMFTILDSIRTREASGPVERFTYWQRFQSLAFQLTSSTRPSSLFLCYLLFTSYLWYPVVSSFCWCYCLSPSSPLPVVFLGASKLYGVEPARFWVVEYSGLGYGLIVTSSASR
jgi:hypothetical protein